MIREVEDSAIIRSLALTDIDINNGGPDRPTIIQRASDYQQNAGATNIRLVRSEHGPQDVLAALSHSASSR